MLQQKEKLSVLIRCNLEKVNIQPKLLSCKKATKKKHSDNHDCDCVFVEMPGGVCAGHLAKLVRDLGTD